MSALRLLSLVAALALAAPVSVLAQGGRGQPGFGEGYERGLRAGTEDSRRGNSFNFTDEGDYRRSDRGYRSQYGSRERYRETFRFGFQEGYRVGYGTRAGGPRAGGPPAWSAGAARGYGRYDLAYQTGLNDGYEAGLNDARGGRRYDPVSERRYRNADRGYRRDYGPREIYKNNYRDAFQSGYARGFADGRRYDRGPRRGGFFGFRF